MRSCQACFRSYAGTWWWRRRRTLPWSLCRKIKAIPWPTTTPTSFAPGDHWQPAQQQASQGTPELVSSQTDDDETIWLRKRWLSFRKKMCWTLHIKPPLFCRHWRPKIQTALDIVSSDVTGFNQFEQYFAKEWTSCGKKVRRKNKTRGETSYHPRSLGKMLRKSKEPTLKNSITFLILLSWTFVTRGDIRLIALWLANGFSPARLRRMASSRCSILDGYVEAFKMLKTMTCKCKFTIPLLPGMVSVWHFSRQHRCVGTSSMYARFILPMRYPCSVAY